ncbi:MAG: efflux RND transporter periplasmic adaptor subunit [Myxococcota bacterium]
MSSEARRTRRLPGRIRARRHAELAFEVGGRVERVAVDDGDVVRVGQVLATLEPTSFDLAVAEGRARLADAKARAAEAEDVRDRAVALHKRGAETEAATVRSRARAASAKGQVELATAALDAARERRRDAVLRAPFSGRIASRFVEPAQTVSVGRVVLRIQGETEGFEVRVSVPESLIEHVEVGSRHVAEVGPRRIPRNVEVVQIAAEPDARQLYPIVLTLEDSKLLKDGMTAEVALQLPLPDRLRGGVEVPLSALRAAQDDRQVVFTVSEGRAQETPVTMVQVADQRAVVAGLPPGAIVVDKGVSFLFDGQPVRRLGVGHARYEGEGR